jgi:predicted transcriptional regulator
MSMTLTIELPPDAGEWLEQKARREGEDPDAVATALLVKHLTWDARDYAEAVAGIRRGLEDFETGRSRPFRDVAAEQREKYDLPNATWRNA